MPPDDSPGPRSEGVSRLTIQALEAAEQGQWDLVEACYEARAEWFRVNPVSPNLAQALLAMDAAVMERVAAAHAATGQALSSAVTVHKQWRTIADSTVDTMAVGQRLNARS